MQFPVVVVVNNECTNKVPAVGNIDDVAVFLAGGNREEPKSFLLEAREVERLGDQASGPAGEEAVG